MTDDKRQTFNIRVSEADVLDFQETLKAWSTEMNHDIRTVYAIVKTWTVEFERNCGVQDLSAKPVKKDN